MATDYIRYSQVQIGDEIKLDADIIWRDRRTAEKSSAPYVTVALIERGRDITFTTTTGEQFTKPATSKALVLR